MKKTIIPMLLLAVLIFSTVPPKYTFEEPDAIKVYNQLQLLKQVLPESELPAKSVTQIIKQTDSLQAIIANQYTKFHPADTTKPKK
jgi:hypothetical protein